MTILKICWILLLATLLGGGLFVYSGVYNIGADSPHLRPVFALLEMFRERSIIQHAQRIEAPPLADPALIAEGAAHYSAMCSGCHLAPGRANSEIRAGLYPQPPRLTEATDLTAAESFWVIKHGVKMTAMPAWGTTHDDEAIWGLVAFLRKLPELSPAQYAKLVGAIDHDHDDHHDAEPAASEEEHSHSH